jgi:hypothetical protein
LRKRPFAVKLAIKVTRFFAVLSRVSIGHSNLRTDDAPLSDQLSPNRQTLALLEPVVGAIILFAFAILSAHLAVTIDHSPPSPIMNAAYIRQECSFITDGAFHADCLQQAQNAKRPGSSSLVSSIKALPAIQ